MQLLLLGARAPGTITNALLRTCVSLPCEHDYYREIQSTYAIKPEWFFTNTSANLNCRGLRQGICMEYDEGNTWLQAVDQNPIAQWLALQGSSCPDGYIVLQRDCCIQCILEAAERVEGPDLAAIVSIIPGRLKGEELSKTPNA